MYAYIPRDTPFDATKDKLAKQGHATLLLYRMDAAELADDAAWQAAQRAKDAEREGKMKTKRQKQCAMQCRETAQSLERGGAEKEEGKEEAKSSFDCGDFPDGAQTKEGMKRKRSDVND